MFKSLGAKLLAATLAFTFVPAVVPSGTPIVGISKADAQNYRYGRGSDGFNGRRYYRPGRYYDGGRRFDGGRRYYGDRRYYRDRDYRHYRRGNNTGAAVAAGIIGLGVGAALANSAQPRYAPAPVYRGSLSAHDRYCLSKYRSYDPRSGTYQPYNGPRRLCR